LRAEHRVSRLQQLCCELKSCAQTRHRQRYHFFLFEVVYYHSHSSCETPL
jgi:hypothetical protein